MRQTIRNAQNEIEYYVDEYPNGNKDIRNKQGMLVGRIVDGQTRDRYGNLLSRGENIGMILREDR